MSSCFYCKASLPPFAPGTLHMHCSCGALLFRPSEGATVLVVHGTEAIAAQLGDMLTAAGFRVMHVADAPSALNYLAQRRARAVVIDVALEGMTAFAVVEQLRALPGGTTTQAVLMAEVHNQAAYKRPPAKLYGADAYIELHRAETDLIPTLERLFGCASPGGLSMLVRVHALAHSIVADIALGHQPAFEAAARGGDPSSLQQEVEAGRRLLAEMVNPRAYDRPDPIGDTLAAFLAEVRGLQP